MLKKICKLFLGLVVCTGSACVTPTHASSAIPVVLTHIQAASATSAKDELIALYNTTSDPINMTGWCLANKSNVRFACFTPDAPGNQYFLPGYSFAVVTSESYFSAHSLKPDSVSLVFAPTNQSSGSLVNSADTLSLYDAQGIVVDSYQWVAAIPTGKVAQRIASNTPQGSYVLYDFPSTWSYLVLETIPLNQLEVYEAVDTEETPESESEAGITEEIPIHPIITEVFPNPAGTDTGNEFIELYNPDPAKEMNLAKYSLRVGKNLEKEYPFPENSSIASGQYIAFYTTQIRFSLLNTTSKVQLVFNGVPVSEVVSYDNPAEGEAWAFIDGGWGYTHLSTPGAENVPSSEPASDESELQTAVKPCPAGQYRNAETNRCRIVPVTQASAPCKDGYYRNTDTNRCRLIASKTSSPAPCKEGQQRNLETNRCRTIAKMSTATHDVKGVATSKDGVQWYFWLGIAGVVLAVLSYAAWEWRFEIQALLQKCKRLFARN